MQVFITPVMQLHITQVTSPELLYFERGKTEMQSLDGWEGVNGFPIRCIKIE